MNRLLELASDRNVELNSKYRSTTNTPILMLCRYNHSDSLFPILRQLLNFEDVDQNAVNRYGHNALTYVLRYFSSKRTIDCVRLLLKRGVRVNVQVKEKNYKWTAIEFLCQFYKGSNLVDIARLLIHRNADLNSASKAVELLKNRSLRRDANILTKIIQSFREGQGHVLNKVSGHFFYRLDCRVYLSSVTWSVFSFNDLELQQLSLAFRYSCLLDPFACARSTT